MVSGGTGWVQPFIHTQKQQHIFLLCLNTPQLQIKKNFYQVLFLKVTNQTSTLTNNQNYDTSAKCFDLGKNLAAGFGPSLNLSCPSKMPSAATGR